jgi:hypothetical protein
MKLSIGTLYCGCAIFFKNTVCLLTYRLVKLTDLETIDEAIIAFNQVMAMETFSLLDDGRQSSMRTDLTLHEIYKTRLLRVDLELRTRIDPFQRFLRKHIRAFRYWRLRRWKGDPETLGPLAIDRKWTYHNTILMAGILGRMTAAVIMAIFLVAPLAILSRGQTRNIQLAIVSSFLLIFALLVATMLKVSNLEMMVVSAGYAAVLSVFVSNVAI